jgi:hypothetical protein
VDWREYGGEVESEAISRVSRGHSAPNTFSAEICKASSKGYVYVVFGSRKIRNESFLRA